MKNDVVRWNVVKSQTNKINALQKKQSIITIRAPITFNSTSTNTSTSTSALALASALSSPLLSASTITNTTTAAATAARTTKKRKKAELISKRTTETLGAYKNENDDGEIATNKCDKIRKKQQKRKEEIINEVQSVLLVQAKIHSSKRSRKKLNNAKFAQRTSLQSWQLFGGKSQCNLDGIFKFCLHFSAIVLLCSLNIGFTTATSPINAASSLLSHNKVGTTDNSSSRVHSSEFDRAFNEMSIDSQRKEFDGHYTHTWAVNIPDGDDNGLADNVAQDHGFVNLGKIIGDHYHFAHHKIIKRSLTPALAHQTRLDEDDRVYWSQQQKAKTRTKRDFFRMRSSRTSPRGLSLVDAMPFQDPKWQQMWYLNRGGGLDMNVIPAWKQGITGKGIVVTILDDGLESDHPDIKDNYDPLASYDVNSHDDDPMPHYDMTDSNRHGTRCAGEVAATANNSYCAVGIAYGASVGGVRMLDGDVTDAVEARSLSHNMQHIDIYSASWGPDDDGKTVDGPGELASRAFIEGVTKGRKGKGSIFIWASGNGGREQDNCNCDGYTNSIWTLSISSATEEGHVPWYSEKCSSTLATTYSSGGQTEKQVVTTDLHHTCTVTHTGTSASAPLAAGIAALVLESNRNLTWRDLQHIVVRTAKPANLKDPTWSRNGVGRRISHSFGYGLMDAAAMVEVARIWKTVPEQQRCEINAPHVDKVIPPKSYITLQLTVKHCLSVNFLEHVQAKISLTTQRRGDIQLYLKSPAGTKVTLLTSRVHDSSRSGFNQWPFMSVHTWGESPHGNWQLEIHNEGRYMAQITQWDLIFYGTETPAQPDDPVQLHPGQLSSFGNDMEHNDIEYDSSGQWRNMQQVGESSVISNDRTNTSCLQVTIDQHCLECALPTVLYEGRCYAECPPHTFQQKPKEPEENNVLAHKPEESEVYQAVDRRALPETTHRSATCGNCDISCLSCYGPLNSQCSACYPGSRLRKQIANETYCYLFAERSSGQLSNIEHLKPTMTFNIDSVSSGLPKLLFVLLVVVILLAAIVLLAAKFYLKPRSQKKFSAGSGFYQKVANADDDGLLPDGFETDDEEEDLFTTPAVQVYIDSAETGKPLK